MVVTCELCGRGYRFLCSNIGMGCKWAGPYGELTKHLEQECEHQLEDCKFCKTLLKRGMLHTHSTSCPFQFYECEICHERHENWLRPTHASICKVNLPCRFAPCGCKFKGNRQELDSHEKNSQDSHYANLLSHVSIDPFNY